jgi:hypothetical protein
MKKVVFVLLSLITLAACQSRDKKTGTAGATTGSDSTNVTSIEWLDSTNQHLSAVTEGTVVEVTYRFKNSGTKNLVIENVSASCGCTVPEKPEHAILPGAEDVIKAKFDSRGKSGSNTKTVTVSANIPEKQVDLRFTVDVTPN